MKYTPKWTRGLRNLTFRLKSYDLTTLSFSVMTLQHLVFQLRPFCMEVSKKKIINNALQLHKVRYRNIDCWYNVSSLLGGFSRGKRLTGFLCRGALTRCENKGWQRRRRRQRGAAHWPSLSIFPPITETGSFVFGRRQPITLICSPTWSKA